MKSDPKLKDGFNAIGYSQGNLIIRGYIHKYNSPPVKNFISMHGPMMGRLEQTRTGNYVCMYVWMEGWM